MSENEPFQFWYHGSKQLLTCLRKQKAIAPEGRPAEEALEAIYFTPNFAFALACAARTPGITEIDLDNRTIRFGDPGLFSPDEMVYIYTIDSSKIPDDRKIWIDELQVAVDMDEIEPDKVEKYKCDEILNYYKTNARLLSPKIK